MRDIVHHYEIVSVEKSDLVDVISVRYLCMGNQVYYKLEGCLYSIEAVEACVISFRKFV